MLVCVGLLVSVRLHDYSPNCEWILKKFLFLYSCPALSCVCACVYPSATCCRNSISHIHVNVRCYWNIVAVVKLQVRDYISSLLCCTSAERPPDKKTKRGGESYDRCAASRRKARRLFQEAFRWNEEKAVCWNRTHCRLESTQLTDECYTLE